MDNYNLDTGKKYIKDIFAPDCFYNVPEYQRPYVWGEEQITALLEDISKALDSDKKKEYFLGCMIWNTKIKRDDNLEYVCQDILDGQQRFITLYLLQAVIRDLSESESLRKKVSERMRQEKDEFDGIPERNRIEFEIRDDSNFLNEFVIRPEGTLNKCRLSEIIAEKDSSSVKNMANAILSMKKWWNFKLQEFESPQKYINDFYTFLSTKVLALYLATPNNLDDAYNLFTVLNSRGLQLQVSDILRAQNLREVKDHTLRKRLAKKWGDYENSIDLPYKSFDDFLWALVFIKMKYRSDDNQSLTKGFNFMYSRNYLEKGEGTFNYVGKYIDHLDKISNANFHQVSYENFFSNLVFILNTTFGNTYFAPLMHYKECFGEYRIVDFLIKLDNICSASWLTGKRNLQSRIFIMLRRMDDLKSRYSDPKACCDAFLDNEILVYDYQDEKASTQIDLQELFDLLESERWGSFSGSKINKTRYLLLKIDLLSTNLNTKLYYNRNTSSVEHLIPQKINYLDWNITEEEHRTWIHRLGNIVLVDRKKNASLSNNKYPIKKQKYKGSIENRANTNYIFMTYSHWNLNTLKENHERVVKMLKKYYLGNSLEILKQFQK